MARTKSTDTPTVTASWTGTLNACWRGRKTFQSFGISKAASMNQEPNNDPGLDVQDCVSFGQRRLLVLNTTKE